MPEDVSKLEHEMQDEGDASVAAPGFVASKSQTQGAFGGAIVGGVVGALIGLVIGFIFLGGTQGLVIAVLAFVFAGGTFGAVTGGFVWPQRKLRDVKPDK